MRKILSTALALVAIVFMAACSEEDFTSFDGKKSGIYIQRTTTTDINGTPLAYSDSMVFTFANYKEEVVEYKLYIPVKIMGDVKDYDRPFKLSVNKELSTAVENEDYVFTGDDCFIPAGKNSTGVLVVLKKTDRLRKQSLRLVFQLSDNENFTAELESYKSTVGWSEPGKQLCGTQFKFIYNNIWTEPMYWSWYGADCLGAWSVAKETVVNKVMDLLHSDWSAYGGKVSYGTMSYIAKKTQKYLQEMANAGTPVYDEDGKYMQLAPSYAVDYSNVDSNN